MQYESKQCYTIEVEIQNKLGTTYVFYDPVNTSHDVGHSNNEKITIIGYVILSHTHTHTPQLKHTISIL